MRQQQPHTNAARIVHTADVGDYAVYINRDLDPFYASTRDRALRLARDIAGDNVVIVERNH